MAIMGTDIDSVLPLSPQVPMLPMSYQNKDFPFRQEAVSLHDSLTPCLTSRIPPGLLLPMHTHLAESLLKSVTLSRLLLSSSHLCCKREKQLALLHEG